VAEEFGVPSRPFKTIPIHAMGSFGPNLMLTALGPHTIQNIQARPKDLLTLPLAGWKMRQSACEVGCWLVL